MRSSQSYVTGCSLTLSCAGLLDFLPLSLRHPLPWLGLVWHYASENADIHVLAWKLGSGLVGDFAIS